MIYEKLFIETSLFIGNYSIYYSLPIALDTVFWFVIRQNITLSTKHHTCLYIPEIYSVEKSYVIVFTMSFLYICFANNLTHH